MHVHHLYIQLRRASTSPNPFAFPHHAHPTPYQIFHLSPGASPQDVKSRYYDLVRVHHPDSPHCRHVDPAVRHTRFQAITAAYASLTGHGDSRGGYHDDPLRAELRRRRRYQDAQRMYEQHTEFDHDMGFGKPKTAWHADPDDRWKDWVLICVGIVSLGAGLLPASLWTARNRMDVVHNAASTNLAAARRDAREHGVERREEIRRRVQEFKEQEN